MASDDSDLKGDSLAVGHIVLDLREATRFGNKKIRLVEMQFRSDFQTIENRT
jgi:hypothetical protein